MNINRKLKAFLCLLLCAAVIGSPVLAVTQAQIDALEEQRDSLRAERDAMQSDIDALKSEQADIVAQKNALDAQNEVYRQEIELIEEQIDLYTNLVDEKEREVEAAQEKEDSQLAAYKQHVRVMEEDGSFTILSLIFGAKSLSELLSNLDMIGEIMQSDKRLYEQYVSSREKTEAVKAEYEVMLGELDTRQAELESEKASLEAKIDEASELIRQYEEQINESLEAFRAQVAAELELEAQIQDMIAEFEKQKLAESIVSTGTYIWPLPGYKPGSAYGWRMHPIYNEMRFHAGEDIGAPSGTAILAADSGVVSYAGVNGGYGNCVMIDHGGGRVTLYGHMSSIAVSYGQKVTQGDTIGYVGSTGVSTGPHLHFEVRVNGQATDPKQYFTFY